MKLLCALILLCLVAAGPAAALAVSPGSMSAPVKITPAVQYVTRVPVQATFTLPTPTVDTNLWEYVNISSEPSGAAIYVDGADTSFHTTNTAFKLPPGYHTFRLTRTGFRDYTASVMVRTGTVDGFHAILVPALSVGAIQQSVSAVGTISTGLRLNRTIVAATIATPSPNTVCLSGHSCLTDADAAALFGPGYSYNVNEICGYAVTSDNQMIPKHCISGNPGPNTTFNCLSGQHCLTLQEAGDTLAPGWYYIEGDTCGWVGSAYAPVLKYCISGSPKGSGLQPGAIQSVAVANQITRIPVSFETTSTTAPGVTKKPLGGRRQTGVVESIFGFFGGIFQHPACPVDQTACGGKCVDVSADPQNCGSCDYLCYDPAVCIQGQCTEQGLPQPDVGNLL